MSVTIADSSLAFLKMLLTFSSTSSQMFFYDACIYQVWVHSGFTLKDNINFQKKNIGGRRHFELRFGEDGS